MMKRKKQHSRYVVWIVLLLFSFFTTTLWGCSTFLHHEKTADAQGKGQGVTEEVEVTIPNNLEEAFIELDKLFPQDLKDDLATGNVQPIELHFGAGMWIRNNWGLWQGSELATYFNELGIVHPDDMSGIILDSYTRRLRGDPIRLEEQIQRYQKYWEHVEPPSN